jgi:hypothetical protein
VNLAEDLTIELDDSLSTGCEGIGSSRRGEFFVISERIALRLNGLPGADLLAVTLGAVPSIQNHSGGLRVPAFRVQPRTRVQDGWDSPWLAWA